jgi:quinol monooxygenase YgiN
VIHVIATIELYPDKRVQFLREFDLIVPEVRAEIGCIEYGGATDLPTGLSSQVAIRPDVVTVVEKWLSLEALIAHRTAPHMNTFRERVKTLILRTTLQVLTPVGESVSL